MIYVKTGGRSALAAAAAAAAWLVAAAIGQAALAGHARAQSAAEQPQRLPAIALQAGMYNIRAEVAQTPQERQKGLMYRRDLAQHEGMLFAFEASTPQCFWMRNTPLPLAIAFVADDGTIVNIDEMKPFTDDSHCSSKPVRYVLEMNQGWFAKRGIKPGFKLQGGPFGKP